jgi:F-type H+-transporting ATPase subunit delta
MMATVAGRYAAALFDLANEENKLAEVEGDLGKVQALLDESNDLRQLVASPLYSTDEQTRAIAEVAGKAGVGALTVNFLKLIAGKRRLPALADMIRNFRKLAAKSRGEVTAEVISAVALADAHVAELKEALKASVGKDVQLATRVDPSLLGGLVVKIGSRMIDSSLKTKLANMRFSLKGAG